ncbi:uncharacterized protein LOC106661683 [Cimex lectularius]|uniref:Salivary secreted protein n=1 Tax=Cimex lectularius TaxID=79782 RepID=A0A8I6R8W7_CIMLE|nr:uncharacterized protein LOC106661683 [Cimex lectularius]
MSALIVLFTVLGCTFQAVYGRHAYPTQDLAKSAVVEPMLEVMKVASACEDLNNELVVMHEVLVDAGVLMGKLCQNVSSAWVNSWEVCPQPNVFKAIPCFLQVYGEYKNALLYYRTDINQMNNRLYEETMKFYTILWKCANSFHVN